MEISFINPFLDATVERFDTKDVRYGGKIQDSTSACFRHIRTDQDGLNFGIVVLVCDCREFTCPYSSIKHEQNNVVISKFYVVMLVQGLQKGLYVLDFRRLDNFLHLLLSSAPASQRGCR